MNCSVKRVLISVGIVGFFFILSGCGSPIPARVNTTSIDPEDGYSIGDVDEGEVIPVEDGVLEGVVPMVEFECSGRVYKIKKDRQDGFSHSLTLVFGELASPDVFEHLVDDGTMNKEFDDGFVLNEKYFKSHIAAFYVHSATDNLEGAIATLKVGNPIRIKGDFVYLKTSNGIVKTSLNPDQFKCKYVFLNEMATVESIYN